MFVTIRDILQKWKLKYSHYPTKTRAQSHRFTSERDKTIIYRLECEVYRTTPSKSFTDDKIQTEVRVRINLLNENLIIPLKTCRSNFLLETIANILRYNNINRTT